MYTQPSPCYIHTYISIEMWMMSCIHTAPHGIHTDYTPMQLNSKRNQVKIRTFNIRKIPQVYSILFCTWYCNSTGIWPSHFRWVLACAAGLIDPALKTTYPGTSPNSLSVMWRLIRSVSFSHSITSISMALMDTWRRATEHISTLPCLVQQAVWSTETLVCRIYVHLHPKSAWSIFQTRALKNQSHHTSSLYIRTYTQWMRKIT